MFNIFKGMFSKKSDLIETKGADFDVYNLSFLDAFGATFKDVRAHLAWHYYKSVSPIYRSVNLISQEFNSIPIVLMNKKTGEVLEEQTPSVPSSEILTLLNQPNYDKTGMEFGKACCSSYLVTGEIYIKMTNMGRLLEIFFVNPADVTVLQGKDGSPQMFTETTPYESNQYIKNDENRYFTRDMTKELYQIIDFNPRAVQEQRGFSRLSSVYYEIEEYIQGNVHNTQMLRRGARPSGVVTVDDSMTKDQINEIKKQIVRFYSGAENAGNVMVMDNSKKFTELALTNKDMEYSKLNLIARQALYDVLEIPASFYDNKASSYNNKMNDRINLYIFAVLPIARRIFQEYTRCMLRYYKDGDKWDIFFVEREIPALELMFDDSILRKSKSGVFTVNELREKYGLDSIGSAGDMLYQPMSEVPIGEGVNTMTTAKDMKAIARQAQKQIAEIKKSAIH